MLRKLLWIESQAFTGWLMVNPGDFEQFFFFQKMIEERAVVDKYAKQKTNMEEEYPRSDGKPKQPVCIEYEIPNVQPVKLSEDGCNMLMLSLLTMRRAGQFWTRWRRFIWAEVIYTSQGWITKIKTQGNNRICMTSSRCFSQVSANGANTSQK